MKKTLLLLGSVLFVTALSAQSVEESVLDAQEAQEVGLETISNDAAKPACGYMRMQGAYYFGMSENLYLNKKYAYLAVPNFQKLTFPSYYGTGVTSKTWKYVDPSQEYNMFNPQITSEDSILTVTYMWDKNNQQIEAPSFTASNGSADSTYSAASYMVVGGSLGNTTTGKYYWSNHSFAKGASSVSYASNRYAFNTEAAVTKWQTSLGVTDLKIKGYAEFFKIPSAPYYLNGVTVYGGCASAFAGGAKVTISRCKYYTNSYNFSSIVETLATATLSKEEIAPTKEGGTAYFLKFKNLKDAEGHDIDGLVVSSAIMVTFTLDEGDTTTPFMPYYKVGEDVKNDVHNYMLCDYIKSGTAYTDVYAAAYVNYTNGPARSFCFYLDADYDYIKHINNGNIYTGKTYTDVPAEGDTKSVVLHSSKEYKDALGLETNWKFEGPDWIVFTPTDNFDTDSNYDGTTNLTITIKPNTNAEVRTGTAYITYKGASWNAKVTQKAGTTAIENVNADVRNADAPTFNLAGQRVNGQVKGIVIKNGKKYVK